MSYYFPDKSAYVLQAAAEIHLLNSIQLKSICNSLLILQLSVKQTNLLQPLINIKVYCL